MPSQASFPPYHRPPVVAVVLLHPDPPQHLHRGQVPQPCWRPGRVHRLQQQVPIPPVLDGQFLAGSLAGRQPDLIDPLPVYLLPGRIDHRRQPVRRRGRQRLQHRPHTFPGQLQPVQVPDPPQHMGGIRALRASRFHQAQVLQPAQQKIKDRVLQAPGSQPGPELTQHTGIETLIF
jgi:hypothetical protein